MTGRLPLGVAAALLCVAAGRAQTPAAASPSPVRMTLSFPDGRDTFRIGEPIRVTVRYEVQGNAELKWVFVNGWGPDVIVTPESGVTAWYARRGQLGYGIRGPMDAVGSVQSMRPVETSVVTLNDQWRFDAPGDYTIRIKALNIHRAEGFEAFAPANVDAISDPIVVHLKEMSDADERDIVTRLRQTLDAPAIASGSRSRTCRELSYLTGEPSTREKVRRLLHSTSADDCPLEDTWSGFDIARNTDLIIQLIDEAIHDVSIPPRADWVRTVVQARRWRRSTVDPLTEKWGDNGILDSLNIGLPYRNALTESLPRRDVSVRVATAVAIWDSLDSFLEPPDVVRQVLIDHFGLLDRFDQDRFVGRLLDPVLVPTLVALATTSPSDRILEALVALSPADARVPFIREILTSASEVWTDTLTTLDVDTLPEIDKPLLNRLVTDMATYKPRDYRTLSQIKRTVEFLARYGSKAIVGDMAAVRSRTRGVGEFQDVDVLLMLYLARWNDATALADLDSRLDTSWYGRPPFLYRLNSTGIDTILRRRLSNGGPDAVSDAASWMATSGPKDDQALIEARLMRWVSDWAGRAAELEKDQSVSEEAMLQVALIRAAIKGSNWQVGAGKADELRATCLTNWCREAVAR